MNREACLLPAGGDRPLTRGEADLVREVFGQAVDPAPVRLRRRRWFPFQPRGTVMAPCGHVHFHPQGPHYSDDFAAEGPALRGLFVHEMVHVWQAQTRGRLWLPLMRHPFCRYDYTVKPGWPLVRYGIEQQAEIVRHWYLAISGTPARGAPPLEALQTVVPFTNS
ncbi:vgr related protein [Novosphingobium bradum]|uniref:Vgr related protein n=1 Tax=Novosphingobium bradum TaxID=1737444 RepID=A0ABV7IU46_9SPHN